MDQQVHRDRINLVFRPQGSHRVYPRHDVETPAPLSTALTRLFAEDLNVPTLPNGLRATLTRTGIQLDIAKSPLELGLQPGDQISLFWSTSNGGGAGPSRPPATDPFSCTLRVPGHVINQTLAHLRAAAIRGTEGICYWIAIRQESSWTVIDVAKPANQASSVRVDVPAEENQRITDSLPSGAMVVAQVHSHLGLAFHSPRDDRHPYSFERGFLSIVVPWGAREGLRWPDDVAVYELVRYPQWRRLSAEDVVSRVVITG